MLINDVHKKNNKMFLFCSIISGIMLGFSYPPSPLYSLAFISFLPLFYIFDNVKSYNLLIRYFYLFLLVFHILTVYWAGGFVVGKDLWMMTAGAALLIIHPLLFLPSIVTAYYVKNKLGKNYGLIAFALFWVTFEYLHSLSEYSFPWLTLGSTQAYDLYKIQIIKYISIYGLSFIIVLFNVVVYLFLLKVLNTATSIKHKKNILLLLSAIILYFAPIVFGYYELKKENSNASDFLKIGIIQPNFDPWHKWDGDTFDKWESYFHQYNTFIDETKILSKQKPDLIIWPETAIPFYICMPRYSMYKNKIQAIVDSINIPIFTGLPTIKFYDSLNAPITAEYQKATNMYAESYNSTIIFLPKQKTGPIHNKSILVPFAERIPYAEKFKFLIQPLKWNVGISNWGKGNDTLVYSVSLKNNQDLKFAGMICYESVYPNYVREFVKRGAQFLIIITNDSWWGKTSGAYQHASFAVLRAVENKKWVVQCANGGISLIVNPYGRIIKQTELFTKTTFVENISYNNEKTFYTNYGDWFANIITMISVVLIITGFFVKKNIK